MAVVLQKEQQLKQVKPFSSVLNRDDYEDFVKEYNVMDRMGGGELTDDADERAAKEEELLEKIRKAKTINEIIGQEQAKIKKLDEELVRLSRTKEFQLKDFISTEDREYQLLKDVITGCGTIQVALSKTHSFIREKYEPYFKDLKEFVVEPLPYARIVKIVGFSRDMVPLVDKLSAAGFDNNLIIKIIATLSTSPVPKGEPDLDALQHLVEACEQIDVQERKKKHFIQYLQLRMRLLCPNLFFIVGDAVASQLVSLAGGLDQLARMDAEAISHLGETQKSDDTPSANTSEYHGAVLLNCDLIQAQPNDLWPIALKMVSNRVKRAVGIDANRHAPDGSDGKRLRTEIITKLKGILDGTLSSNYHPQRNKKRTREAQEREILNAAGVRTGFTQQIAGGEMPMKKARYAPNEWQQAYPDPSYQAYQAYPPGYVGYDPNAIPPAMPLPHGVPPPPQPPYY